MFLLREGSRRAHLLMRYKSQVIAFTDTSQSKQDQAALRVPFSHPTPPTPGPHPPQPLLDPRKPSHASSKQPKWPIKVDFYLVFQMKDITRHKPKHTTVKNSVRGKVKKNGIIWEYFPSVGPPPLPPFWEPLVSSYFWSSQKCKLPVLTFGDRGPAPKLQYFGKPKMTW